MLTATIIGALALFALLVASSLLAAQAARDRIRIAQAAALTAIVVVAIVSLRLGHSTAWLTAVQPIIYGSGVMLLIGLCWDLIGGSELCRSASHSLGLRVRQIAVLFGVLIVLIAPKVPMGPTGDEPSYLHYAASLTRYGDLRFTPARIAEINDALALPADIQPHMWPFKVPNPPLHFIGLSIVLMPLISLGTALGAPVLVVRVFIALLFCTALLTALALSIRLTGLRNSSLAATLLVFGSLPVLGMSYQIYPETLATLLVLVFYLLLLSPGRSADQHPRLSLATMCCILLFLPWLHSKFALTSATLAVVLMLARRQWRLRDALWALALLACGTAAFLTIHLSIYGEMLWKQSKVFWYPFGVLGQIAGSDYGMLVFLPYLIVLPLGIAAMKMQRGTWMLPATLMLPTITMLLLAGNAENWGSGGDTPLRFYAPFIVLWIPILACAFNRLAPRHILYIVLFAIPIVWASAAYLQTPILAYPPGRQTGRALMDELFSRVYLRELFPHFPYQNYGVRNPHAEIHSFGCIAIFGALSLVICTRIREKLWPAVPVTVAFILLVLLSRACSNPNWTRTAADVFTDQVRFLSRLEHSKSTSVVDWEGHTRAHLTLPAALRPIEVYTKKRAVINGTSLAFGADQDDGRFTGGPNLHLPAGFYRARFLGGIRATTDTMVTVLFRPIQVLPMPTGALELRQLAANDLLVSATKKWQNVSTDVVFQVDNPRYCVDLGFGRVGAADLILTRFEIDFIGLEKPDDEKAVAARVHKESTSLK